MEAILFSKATIIKVHKEITILSKLTCCRYENFITRASTADLEFFKISVTYNILTAFQNTSVRLLLLFQFITGISMANKTKRKKVCKLQKFQNFFQSFFQKGTDFNKSSQDQSTMGSYINDVPQQGGRGGLSNYRHFGMGGRGYI